MKRKIFKLERDDLDPCEEEFLHNLYKFMKSHNRPIVRIPSLGFKQGKRGSNDNISQRKKWSEIGPASRYFLFHKLTVHVHTYEFYISWILVVVWRVSNSFAVDLYAFYRTAQGLGGYDIVSNMLKAELLQINMYL